MSKAGCPYDNAIREIFYNTFMCEYLNIRDFKYNAEVDKGVYEFIYIIYNQIRSHRYNGDLHLLCSTLCGIRGETMQRCYNRS